jgi:hypothetical protein
MKIASSVRVLSFALSIALPLGAAGGPGKGDGSIEGVAANGYGLLTWR